MSSLGSPSPFFLAGKKAYEVERSLRFVKADYHRFTRTPSSAGDRKTWTWSAWIKRGSIGNRQILFSADNNATNATYLALEFQADDNFRCLGGTETQSSQITKETQMVFRDTSAWYHLVFVLDATNSIARLYVNNSEVTDWNTNNNPSNQNYQINATTQHFLGRYGSSLGSSASNYFDGYMAEVNFIDGQAYDPSYFGETNSTTGQWNPKKYIGSYGTNGFYLNFSDNSGTTATTLGKDSSGNGNNFTPNNFSVAAGTGNDSLEDTPTNNFATLNALKKPTNGALSNGNLDGSGNASTWVSFFSTILVSSGKWFCEVKVNATRVGVGIAKDGANENSYLGSAADTYAYFDLNGKWNNNSNSSYGATYTTNDIIGMALDMDAGTLIFYKNGASQGTAFTGLSGEFALGFSVYGGSANASINYGQRAFDYTPPTGYKALNSANLPDPTIKLPNKHFNTLLYTGNGGSQSITGLNFQPDWAWIKERTGASIHHSITDSVRGVLKTISSSRTDIAEKNESSGLNQLLSNGLGFNGEGFYYVNRNSEDYVAWNWNAGDTDGKTYTVKVVSDSGNKYRFDNFGTSAVTLDLAEGGTYIFDQSDSSNAGHPLRFSTTSNGTHGGGSEYTTGVITAGTPGQAGAYTQIVVAASAPTLYYYCTQHSGMGGQANTNSTLGSSNFDGTIQSVAKVNASAGFSIIKYTGNGTGGASIGHGLGVPPKAYIIKRRDGGSGGTNWRVYHHKLNGGSNPEQYHLILNATNAESGQSNIFNDTAPTSSVFTVGTHVSVNGSSGTHVAYCFSEVAGYSKFGSYTGNGSSDGTFVYTGFKPAFILTKSTTSTHWWEMADNTRTEFNPRDKTLYSNRSDTEYSGSQYYKDFLSNGFKARSDNGGHNGSGNTYIYLAFAESPFKNARAR